MTVINPVNKQKVAFTYNQIFQNASQDEIYQKVCEKQVKHVMQGYNACVMATGQTSAGKSYSIIGDETLAYKTRGMVVRAVEQIFDCAKSSPGTNFNITFSCMEVVNERINDLLRGDSQEKQTQVQVLEQKDGKLLLKNLQQIQVTTIQDALELLFTAENCKKVSETEMNANSSRSHVIYVVQVAQSSRTDEQAQKMVSKLYLVDLAGSEKSNNSFINKSLQNLQICIQQLARNNFHVPFRASKLTQVLRDCLGGSSKTTIVGCIRGEQQYLSETLQTLRFCQEAVNIKTEASVNIVNRMFEDQSSDQRAVNSQITNAILEAAQQRGGMENLQSKALRELEQENKKLKAEIMLLSGQQAEFTADQNKANQLRANVDLWLQDGGNLPELTSRSDYEEVLAYLKCIIVNQRRQGAGMVSSAPQQAAGAPQIAQKEVSGGSRPQSKPGAAQQAKDKKGQAAVELPQLFGSVQNTGAISIGTMQNIAQAANLNQALVSASVSNSMVGSLQTSQAIDTKQPDEYDENAKFLQYKETSEGQRLLSELNNERATKQSLVSDLRSIKNRIIQNGESINQCKKQIQEKIDLINNQDSVTAEPAAGNKKQHNVINYNKNQQQESILVDIRELKKQIINYQCDIENLTQQTQEVKQKIEKQKHVEEYARRRMMTSFEGYCAGLYKKINEIKQEKEDDNQIYAEILGRTRKTRKVGRV